MFLLLSAKLFFLYWSIYIKKKYLKRIKKKLKKKEKSTNDENAFFSFI